MTKAIYRVVGMKHHEGAEELVRTLQTGAPMILIRDPDNKYDRFAVQVWAKVEPADDHAAERKMIGFVLGKQVQPLADYIDKHGGPNDGADDFGKRIDAKFAMADGPHVEVEEKTNG